MTDYRAALIDFYQKHNPDKIREIDLLLAKYKGREEELLHALKVKYGVHKATQAQPPSPPPQQAAPPPKAEDRSPEPDARTERIMEKKIEPPPPVFKDYKPPINRKEDDYQGPLSSGANKGRTAAERAEYWKKELEKRERERTGAREPSPKYVAKSKKEAESSSDEYEYEEESSRGSWFTVNRIIASIIVTVLLGGIAYVLLKSDLRKAVGAKLGLNEKSERKEEKKMVIEPAELAQKDTTVASTPGDFALDIEEDAEDRDFPEKAEEVSKEPARNEAPSRTEANTAGGPKRNHWYLSYSSVSNESLAKKIVRQIQSEGYTNSGYYYIPDYDPRGKRLYKVYIGPFSSMEAAEAALEGYLAKKGTGAYPFLLK